MIDDENGAAARRRVAAVLFDMDGTLLDSEPAYFESDRAFLSAYGIDYDEALNASFIGRGSMEMMRALARSFPDSPLGDVPLEERIRLKDEAYSRFAPARVAPFPASVALAKALAGMGVPLAIASGSSPDVIAVMLEASGLGGLFPVRVSSAEVPRGKPAPDIFIEAARRCGVAPEACLVLEDSRYGVAAALAAGMACVALPAPGSPGPEDFAVADMVVEGGAAALDHEAVLRRFAWDPGA
ncbi:MAG: HAD family phosphatase [Spirochaetes bacterium]|nr:HAD family phosphatase [Spirochaetota bacterium]MBU1081846.1 HAD family phosphatase [Spirochaetota bacterium]